MLILTTLLSIFAGLILGLYLGFLIVKYFFNSGVNPMKSTEKVSDYEIMKHFEEKGDV